jgi:hypothetical protein
MNLLPTPNNSKAWFSPVMTSWRAGRDNPENLEMLREVNWIEPKKCFAAFLFSAALLSFGGSFAAALPVVRASYNAIGGVFTPIWLAQENKFSTNTAPPSI